MIIYLFIFSVLFYFIVINEKLNWLSDWSAVGALVRSGSTSTSEFLAGV